MPKTNAEKQRDFKERMEKHGFVRFYCWIRPEWRDEIKKLIQKLEEQQTNERVEED